MPEYICGLDIGTTKVSAIIAELNGSPEPTIIGVGTSPSEGMRKGVVVNLEKTINAIRAAVEEAEKMADVNVQEVYAGIAGDHVRSINGRGVVAVSGPGNEVTRQDIHRVIDAAKAVALPMDREILHVLPQEFTVDDQSGIKDPVGMSGVRLEAEVHIVTGAISSAQNIQRSISRAGMQALDLVLEPLASSYAVLSEDEKELGVIVIDLGGGTTDIAMFYEGCIRHTAVVPLGGKNVTNDLAIGLRTPVEQAEQLKIKDGCAVRFEGEREITVEVAGVGGRSPRKISKSLLVDIIQPRVEEILTLAYREVKKSNLSSLMAAGVVLTGGGSLLTGTVELAEEIFEMPVKGASPGRFKGLRDLAENPIHATGVGLLHYGMQTSYDRSGLVGRKNGGRIKAWFNKLFHGLD